MSSHSLSDWLAGLDPIAIYPEAKLRELEAFGIVYRAGQITSRIQRDRPYITFGRLATVTVHTERELVGIARGHGLGIRIDQHVDELLLFGFEVVAAVWMLLHPIVESGPPSTYAKAPEQKARLDLAAIRRYGY